MAIVTGDLYKGFTFGDISSKAYGVYITQEAAYDAPERDTEVVEIAGRNGAYILDKGRYKNITVSYKCGIALGDEQSFENAIRVFRNALASEAGKYVRLEDEYNPNEYRQAAFLGGIDVNMADRRAGEFTVSFDAKPQRFLKSGETAVTIGGDVTNTKTETGSIVTIEGTGADKVTSLVAQIEPVQAGSGDPSPTNVRAITGWTAANVNVAGKNLLPKMRDSSRTGFSCIVQDDGSMVLNGSVTSTFFGNNTTVTLPAGTYIVGVNPTEIKYNSGLQILNHGIYATSRTLTLDKAETLTVRIRIGAGVTFDNVVWYPMIRLATETDDTYEPYKGHTVPVSFGSAGTVYGGTVDVVTGVLTVTHASVNIGNLTWSYNDNGNGKYFSSFITGKKIGSFNLISSAFKTGTNAYISNMQNGDIIGNASSTNIYAKDSRYTTEQAFVSEHASHTIVYELATPQTYNLTAQQVALLTGQNHVWADTGNITITWGDDPNKLVNPTLYDAHPLLSFTASGAGTININNDTISVTNQPIGDIILANVTKLASGESVTWSDTGRYQTGDAIRIDSIPAVQTTVVMDSYSYANYTNYISDDMDYLSTASTARGIMIQHSIPSPPQFVAGTARSVSYTARVIDKVKHKTTGDIVDCTTNLTVTIAYDGAHSITATTTVTASLGTASTTVTIDTVTVNSTKPSLTGTAYIDLDIGEAYSIDGGAVVSINDSVSLGASLPVLKPSVNAISKTGAVANLKVTPRWWEL